MILSNLNCYNWGNVRNFSSLWVYMSLRNVFKTCKVSLLSKWTAMGLTAFNQHIDFHFPIFATNGYVLDQEKYHIMSKRFCFTKRRSMNRTSEMKPLYNIDKKRFKNRMESPKSQRRVKIILRLLYISRPFQRYQLCEDWSVRTLCI
jgi:hypothetical protein